MTSERQSGSGVEVYLHDEEKQQHYQSTLKTITQIKNMLSFRCDDFI